MPGFDSAQRQWVALLAALAGLYCVGAMAAPWLESLGLSGGSWLRLAYAPACHQQLDRCLNLGFGPLAVCARCSGLYLGGLLGLIVCAAAGARVRPALVWLVAAASPTLADVILAVLGLPSLPNWPRFLAALPPGTILGLLVADAIGDIVARVGRDPVE